MIDIFSLEPITHVAFVEFFLYLFAYSSMAMTAGLITYLIFMMVLKVKFERIRDERYLNPVFLTVGSIIEELVFRGIPYLFAGAKGVIFGTFAWVVFHLRSGAFASASIIGILFYRYWIGGLPLLAIYSHVFYNLTAYYIFYNLTRLLQKRR